MPGVALAFHTAEAAPQGPRGATAATRKGAPAMKNIRRGIGVLALAFAIGTVGACSGNSSRAYPDRGPRVSRGAAGSSGASARNRARAKRSGDTPNGNNGQHRGQRKNGNNGNGNKRGSD